MPRDGIYGGDDDDGEPAAQRTREVVAPGDGTTRVDATAVADEMRRGPTTARSLRPEHDPEWKPGAWVKIGSRELPEDPRYARPGSKGLCPASATVPGEGHVDRVSMPYRPTDLANSGSEGRGLFPDYVVEQAVAGQSVPAFVGAWVTAKVQAGAPPRKVLQTLARRVMRDCRSGQPPGYVAPFLYAMANCGYPPPAELMATLERNPHATEMLAYCHQIRGAMQ